ncbi:MAG TPA: twitching motility protein, partial [Desulfohalobiaceae bacterium]|nr:twitching motility protein [Desulfohalobiaceae bacterium]
GEDGEKTFYNVLSTSSSYGMRTFDDALVNMYRQGVISEEIAMLNGSDKSRLGQMIDWIKSERGEKVTDIEGLELDVDYNSQKGSF